MSYVTALDAALDYAGRGWPVVPLHYPTSAGCSCRAGSTCKQIGKHPATHHGVDDATTDVRSIGRVWSQYPSLNVGIATGHGCDVLDLDDRVDAPSALMLALERHTPGVTLFDDDPPVVRTGRGLHVFYAPTGFGNRARIVPGADWRGLGGYVVGPPSTHASGERYVWQVPPRDVLPECPLPLLDLVGRAGPFADPVARARVTVEASADILDRLDTAAHGADGLVAFVEDSVEGERNHRLYWAACRAYEDRARGDLDDDGLRALVVRLNATAVVVGLTQIEISRTLRSARRTTGER